MTRTAVGVAIIERKILTIRGERVMLDVDLATLYGVETKAPNQAVKRNVGRFPPDFMFRLNAAESRSLRSQSVTSNGGRGGARHTAFAFTEQGVAMLSSLLRSTGTWPGSSSRTGPPDGPPNVRRRRPYPRAEPPSRPIFNWQECPIFDRH